MWTTYVRKHKLGLRCFLIIQRPDGSRGIYVTALMHYYTGWLLKLQTSTADDGSALIMFDKPLQYTTTVDVSLNMYPSRDSRLPCLASTSGHLSWRVCVFLMLN